MVSATHPSTEAARYRREALWADRTVVEQWEAALRDHPGVALLVDGSTTLTREQLDQTVARLAAGLRGQGVGRGDVVTMLLPSWWEAVAVFLAAQRLGAVANFLHLTYREREVRFVLEQTRSRVVFVCGTFGRVGYDEIVAHAVAALPDPPLVVRVRGDSPEWAGLLVEDRPSAAHDVSSPDDVALLIYTSGTTADPKGVLHSHNTLLRCVADMTDIYELTERDRIFVPSPVSHVAGLMFVLAAAACGATAVLLDVWNEDRALDLVLEHGCTFAGGAMPFVQGLVAAVERRGLSPDAIPVERGNCGAADVPPDLIERADRVLGASYSRGYGLTEGIVVSVCGQREGVRHRAGTDGRIVPGVEVRLVGDDLADVPPGTTGELLVRGPQNFVGYLDPAHNDEAFVGDGWFRTGDLAAIVDDEYVTIVGRAKEMISRGGENISAREVEEVLQTLPGVREIAVVGLPDRRLGEVACAVVVVDRDTEITLEELADALRTAGLAPQKWPEHLRIWPEPLPRTVTGKIRKLQLREAVLAGSEALGQGVPDGV